MKHRSFSARVSKEISIITSIIFVLCISIIAVKSTEITRFGSIEYAAEIARNTATDIESFFNVAEATCNILGATVEEYYKMGVKLDTSKFYNLFERTLASNRDILGIGIYFEPYKYSSKTKCAGIYGAYDFKTGMFVHEWQDDMQTSEDGWDYFNAEWYKAPLEKGDKNWRKPFMDYLETSDKEYRYITSYSIPMKDAVGEIFGICVIDVSLDWLNGKLMLMKPFENSNVVVFDRDLNIICNPLSDTPYEGSMLDTPFIKGMENVTYSSNGSEENWVWKKHFDVLTIDIRDGLNMAFCVTKSTANGWTVFISNLYIEAFKTKIAIFKLIFLIGILGIIAVYFFCHRVMHKESRALVEYASAASKITDGKFDVPIPEVKYNDEICDLGKALTYMQTSVTNYINELKRTTSEKERLAGELDVARKIQMEMLSREFPEHEKASVYADSFPAKEVGGDLYDFCLNGNNLNFIIGDVSGKGVPAALLMAITIAAFRATIKENKTIREIVELINDTFRKSNEDLMFVTLALGRLNLMTGELTLCNAGHNPVILIHPEGNVEFIKAKTNMVCGVVPGFKYQEDTMILKKGARLLLYSDGITEAEDCNKNQYSEQRLMQWAANQSFQNVSSDENVVSSLFNSVHNFTGSAEPNDDATAMSITLIG